MGIFEQAERDPVEEPGVPVHHGGEERFTLGLGLRRDRVGGSLGAEGHQQVSSQAKTGEAGKLFAENPGRSAFGRGPP